MVLISGKSGRRMDLFEDCTVCAYVRRKEEQQERLEFEELREAIARARNAGADRR